MAKLGSPEPFETQVICKDCNAYLWSTDTPDPNGKLLLRGCPCQIDPLGKCTGRLKYVTASSYNAA